MLALAVWTVEALLQIASPSDPQIRPDGGAYSYVLRGDVLTASLSQTSGATLTVGKGSRPRWSPDSRSLAFVSRGQLYVWNSSTRATQKVTDAASGIGTYSWTPDGLGFVYIAADGGPTPDPIVVDQDYHFSRLYLQKLANGRPQRLTTGDRHVISFSISSDGKSLVYAAQPTPRNRDSFNVDLYRHDLGSGAESPLVSQPGRDADPSYSPDGRWVTFHSQGGSTNYFEARHVALVPAKGGEVRYLTRAHQEIDVFRGGIASAWSKDSKTLLYTAGRGVIDVLVEHNLETDQARIATERISGTASCTNNLQSCVFLKASATRPPEVFLRRGVSEEQLTHIQDGIAEYSPVRSEVVHWKASDGTSVEGMLWLPTNYINGQRVPMLTELHGGPTGVTLDSFPMGRTYPIPVFLQQGFAVFSPNFRGSVNYGSSFRLKNARSQGIGDYDDVMTGIDALVKRGIADPNRLGVMGWSYGGYLTGSVITQNNRFKAASIGAPATDWFTYYGQSDAGPEILATYFGGSPWDMPEQYSRHSSRSGLKNIRTPALLQVGSLDIDHNGEIHRALTDHNVPVEYVIYPREGHSISEPAHIRDVMDRNLRWFLRWIPRD